MPVVVPAAAVSPGNNTCNFDRLPALTCTALLAIPVSVPSVLVNCTDTTACLSVTDKVPLPLVKLTAVAVDGVNVPVAGPVSVTLWLPE